MSVVAKKTVAKKTVAKKAPVASAPKPENTDKGTVRSADVPWNDKKVMVFKTLLEIGAHSANSGKTSKEVITANPKLTSRDVRHYSYHAAAVGLIGFGKIEGKVGYVYFLTAKGVKLAPTCETLIKQKPEKAAKEPAKKVAKKAETTEPTVAKKVPKKPVKKAPAKKTATAKAE